MEKSSKNFFILQKVMPGGNSGHLGALLGDD